MEAVTMGYIRTAKAGPRARLEKRVRVLVMCNKGQEGKSTSKGRWLQAQARVLRNNNSYGLTPGSLEQICKRFQSHFSTLVGMTDSKRARNTPKGLTHYL